MTTKTEALLSLKPGAEWTMKDGVLIWLDSKQTEPTESEINAEIARLNILYTNEKYKRDRAAEYPSIVDQLDDIYHNGIDAWKATIKTTKDKYPKP
tara:strand:+ start:1067 stop:1354 length:288 start_codon:yes stop_codon:yes gene_type:complete